MSHRWSLTFVGLIAVAMLAVACGSPTPEATQPPIGMANPASTYCADLGYTLEMRDEAGGQAGYCVFPDKTECEEWAFFRGECGQPNSYCEKNGGKISSTESGAVCTFSDGSTCPEADFMAGTCKAGS